jgi:acetyltransferase
MLRHTLDPLFEPTSLLIVSDRPLPLFENIPPVMATRTTRVDCPPGLWRPLPKKLNGLVQGERVDLVVVCMPPLLLQRRLFNLVRVRPRAVILMAHDAVDPSPDRTRELCALWAQKYKVALLGPYSFGLQRPHLGLNLSQHPVLARSGRAALIAQSRTIMASVMDWADDAHIGFSAVVAISDEAFTSLPEVLDYLASDPRTDSIALYIDETGYSREFMSALRAAASVKPVVVLKSGATLDTEQANAAFDAALRRAGAVRVRYYIQLFAALKVFTHSHRPKGPRMAVISNGEGPAQLALDMSNSKGPVVKAELTAATRRRLGKLLEPGARALNPIVTHSPLMPSMVTEMIDYVTQDSGVDGVLLVFAPDARTDFYALTDELINTIKRSTKPVLPCFIGEASMRPIRRLLDDVGTPAFRTPESAANAFGVLASYHYNQQLLLQIQPAEPNYATPRVIDARELIAQSYANGQTTLGTKQALVLFEKFNLIFNDTLENRLSQSNMVSEIKETPIAYRISVERDKRFGPVIRFSAGGVMGSLAPLDDGVDLAPLNLFLSNRLVKRSQIWQRLGRHAVSPAAFRDLLNMLEWVSDLVSECAEVDTVTIDPLELHGEAWFARRAEIKLIEPEHLRHLHTVGYNHMAIHPYPRRWVQRLVLKDGTGCLIRPIQPDDASALQIFVRGLSDEARYMRFVSLMRELTPKMLARYTLIDYHRELALIATVPQTNEHGQSVNMIVGLAHYLRNRDGRTAEYALVVADDWQGRGLGRQLMSRLIDAARDQGLELIEGLVIGSNRPMRNLMQTFGMVDDVDAEDASMRRIWIALNAPADEM